MSVSIEISVGELVDKITILEIKRDLIRDESKRRNVAVELECLLLAMPAAFALSAPVAELRDQLKRVNFALWRVEDDLRGCERAQDFDENFIALARSVYVLNDRRAALKQRVNQLTHSRLMEEKSYAAY